MKKTSTFMILMALAAGPLMGQSAKEVADNLTLPTLAPGDTRLTLPTVPDGASIQFGGADFEQIISADGSIHPVLSEVPVRVFFKVTKDGETVDSKDYELKVKPAEPAAEGANPKPDTIPAILQWQGGQGVWKPGEEIRVSGRPDCHTADLVKELSRMFPKSKVTLVPQKQKADIRLGILQNPDAKTGNVEGYRMVVSPQGIHIGGDTATGTYWGTRTLLQILAHKGAVPCGTAVDFPRFPLRGFMFDIARTPFTLQDLRDVVDIMAWYKMNDLHLGLNNNYIFHEDYAKAGRDPFKESYTAFRLESKVKGKDGTPLTAQDLSYSKKDFRDFIDYAKARGVNIVPEFDTPGHALSFTRVRPDLIYQGRMRRHDKRRCEMLDAANPETVRFVSEVFDEYLLNDEKLGRPVFEGCVIHVGSDEFFGEAEDYRKYANGLLRHIVSRGYTPRFWGSLSAKPGKTPVISTTEKETFEEYSSSSAPESSTTGSIAPAVSKRVQMNLWSRDWMKVQEAVDLGYDIINTNDGALYIVPFANYYRMDRNHKWVYNNWIPNRIGGVMMPSGHPQLIGSTFAVWNDMTDLRHNGYGMPDIWDSISGSLDVLCGKLWGEETRHITFDQHRNLVKAIGQGPSFTANNEGASQIAAKGASLELPYKWESKAGGLAPNYHVTMLVKLTKATPGEEQALLSGPEGVLLGVMKDGTIGFRRADGMEFSWDAKLPQGKQVKLELIGTLGKTRLILDGQEVEKMTLNNFNSLDENFAKRTRNIVSTFVLPRKLIGAAANGSALFKGSIKSVEVKR